MRIDTKGHPIELTYCTMNHMCRVVAKEDADALAKMLQDARRQGVLEERERWKKSVELFFNHASDPVEEG